MSSKNIYITTPIYYVNDSPHIGHAYTTIAGDILARYHRLRGEKVFYLTGTDEHGQKIQESAKTQNLSEKQLVDKVVKRYVELWEILGISYDGFIRTTDSVHSETVKYIFQTLYDKGDIYKGEYEGWYCVPCETYYTETQVKENKICPECGRAISKVKEEAYFFKLSKYADKLLEFYKENKQFLEPKIRAKEMINFISQGLQDLCVTRTTVDWGIKVPFDEKHCIYVWFDALINYISALGFVDYVNSKESNFENFWPATVHLVGKEIYKFHTIIWPAMLMSLGLKPPKRVFGHGWWTVEGSKMSKSVGNVVDPKDIVNEFNRDVLRYFLMREVPFGSDGDFSHNNLVTRYNSELANDLGNLVSRVLKMVNKYFDDTIDKVSLEESVIKDQYEEIKKNYDIAFENINITEALNLTMQLVSIANKYVDEMAPWVLAKDESKKEELKKVLYELVFAIKKIALLINPFMPDTSIEILKQISIDDVNIQEEANIKIGELKTLFPRR